MQIAIVNNKRLTAFPNGRGSCPSCEADVIAKTGQVVSWHWAHSSSKDCDSWSEESEWHLAWKSKFPETWREQVVGNHRADIRSPSGLVVEFQRSPISQCEIRERELFYGRMIWVLCGTDFRKNLCLRCGRKGSSFRSFRWKWPRKSWWNSKKRIIIDLGDERMLVVKKLYSDTPCGGWGRMICYDEFMLRIKRDAKKVPV